MSSESSEQLKGLGAISPSQDIGLQSFKVNKSMDKAWILVRGMESALWSSQ
jgi:hypothetical protein